MVTITMHLLSSLLLVLPVHVQAQQARCQWSSLRSATDLVLESLAAGLTPSDNDGEAILSRPSLAYTQNFVPTPISSPESILSSPLSVAHTHSIIDQDACAAFIKLVLSSTSTNQTQPAAAAVTAPLLLVAAQIHYLYTPSLGTTVTALDLVSVRQGDWKLDNGSSDALTALAGAVQREDWSALSRDSQDARAVLEGVARGYLDFLGGTTNASVVAASGSAGGLEWGRPCARLDGGVYVDVRPDESCVVGVDVGRGGEGVTERRLVVDESIGAASVLARDGRLGGAPSVFELRVVNGKLRYVQEFAATGPSGTRTGS